MIQLKTTVLLYKKGIRLESGTVPATVNSFIVFEQYFRHCFSIKIQKNGKALKNGVSQETCQATQLIYILGVKNIFINHLFIILMKKIFLALLAIAMVNFLQAHSGHNYEASDIFKALQAEDKVAIMMVHFGTTHEDTRQQTIDVINQKAKDAFPNVEVREAYTSRIVVKRLGERGIVKLNATQVFEKLRKDGFTHILVQPTCIIDGIEMEALSKEIAKVQSSFKEIRVGNPLLYTPEDYENVIKALTPTQDTSTAYIWVGHGTYDSATAQYAMLDYMLKQKGFTNNIVGTIEGYPSFDDVLLQLEKSGLKKVMLNPFLFVAGEHAKNDIAEDWKNDLEKEGYTVEVSMKGLGQIPAIQDCFITHLKFIATHRMYEITKKKEIYAITGEKIE